MSMKDDYERRLKAQMDEWDARIAVFKAKADKAGADAEVDYRKNVERLRKQQRDAQKKLDELRKSGDDAWKDLRAGIDSAWESFGRAVQDATSRFK